MSRSTRIHTYASFPTTTHPKKWSQRTRKLGKEKSRGTRNAWLKVIYISFRPLFIHFHEEWKDLSATTPLCFDSEISNTGNNSILFRWLFLPTCWKKFSCVICDFSQVCKESSILFSFIFMICERTWLLLLLCALILKFQILETIVLCFEDCSCQYVENIFYVWLFDFSQVCNLSFSFHSFSWYSVLIKGKW